VTDTLRALFESTLNFYNRFEVIPELATSIHVFEEEVRELIEAAQAGTDKNHIAEEAADVMVTALGICIASGVDMEQLLAQTRAVIAKNDAKTHETHAINEYGKIARRAKG
jgi:NTP pyrophosphatase (non-canonical NTP hydrolase)